MIQGVSSFIRSAQTYTVFHGTDAEFDRFEKGDIGFHFGSEDQAQDRIKDLPEGKVKKYEITLDNPYDIVSDLGRWDDMEMLKEYFGEANEGPVEDWSSIKTPQDFVDEMRRLGYDGIEYLNNFEGANQGQAYIVFDADNIMEIK